MHLELLTDILSIPSPTFEEQELVKFFKKYIQENLPQGIIYEHNDSLIVTFPVKENKPHISLIGHSDVVPQHFIPYIEGDNIHGAGVSDMLSSIACFLILLKEHERKILDYNFSLVIYAREEGTKLVDNGLYDLINVREDFFSSIDLAIVGEPTDNEIQIGCVGSIHATGVIKGVSCHSARPWNGKNALYLASNFINKMATLETQKHEIFNVSFYDVMQITESFSQKGRTTLPAFWQCNINFRFAPVYTEKEAQELLIKKIKELDSNVILTIDDSVPSGKVIETELFKHVCTNLKTPIRAKQAWTDVAQLSNLNISCFNFGSGMTSQAHKDNEYASIKLINEYYKKLTTLFKVQENN